LAIAGVDCFATSVLVKSKTNLAGFGGKLKSFFVYFRSIACIVKCLRSGENIDSRVEKNRAKIY